MTAVEDPLFAFCRALPAATEDIKWGNDLVFSVGGKMFAAFLFPEGEPFSFQTDPFTFAELIKRENIIPAPYLARHHWVSVQRRDALPADEFKQLLRESYARSVAKLSRKKRRELGLELLKS